MSFSSSRPPIESKHQKTKDDFRDRIRSLEVYIDDQKTGIEGYSTYGEELDNFEKEKAALIKKLNETPETLNPMERELEMQKYGIIEKSQKFASLPPYHDYCENGVAEIKGMRYAQQEDAVIKSSLDNLHNLSPEERKQVFELTFAEMQEKHGQRNVGSTACITTAWSDGNKVKYCNANVGDSTSFLIVVDDKGSPVHARIHPIHDQRFARLALNRAIGDNVHKEGEMLDTGGLKTTVESKAAVTFSHKPDITEGEYELKPGQRAFIVTACDGLTERMDKDADAQAALIAQYVHRYRNNGESEIAFRLLETALSGKDIDGKQVRESSTDNISIIVTEIKPNQKPIINAVFDGHGGDDVSKPLGKNTPVYINNHCDQVINRPFRQLLSCCEKYQVDLEKNITKLLESKHSHEIFKIQSTIKMINLHASNIRIESDHEKITSLMKEMMKPLTIITETLISIPETKPLVKQFNLLFQFQQILLSPEPENEKLKSFKELLESENAKKLIHSQGKFKQLFHQSKTPEENFYVTAHSALAKHELEQKPLPPATPPNK